LASLACFLEIKHVLVVRTLSKLPLMSFQQLVTVFQRAIVLLPMVRLLLLTVWLALNFLQLLLTVWLAWKILQLLLKVRLLLMKVRPLTVQLDWTIRQLRTVLP
jgi:hypothetical protein